MIYVSLSVIPQRIKNINHSVGFVLSNSFKDDVVTEGHFDIDELNICYSNDSILAGDNVVNVKKANVPVPDAAISSPKNDA